MRILYAFFVGRDGASMFMSMIEEYIVSLLFLEDDLIVDYVVFVMSGCVLCVGLFYEMWDFLDRFASRVTREMRRFGVLGFNFDDCIDNFVCVVCDLMFNFLVLFYLFLFIVDDVEDVL